MEIGTIRQVSIDVEMQASYLDYAMSVIVARALPDVRDGLKPVHRRILYAMHDLGLQSDKPYKKSSRVVGEVLGKYHPHGDAAVYEAMVRMAQDFSLRYPLVDGQGNFGSVDGDNAAAMRYTEVRLAPIAMEMLADIDKDTVDWTDNFDGTLREPVVMPAGIPNLIINGSSGIAVGMSTNIPPHNLSEVCDALCFLIDHHEKREEITVDELMRFIPGPDFPTGAVVYRYAHEGNGETAEQVDVIARAYASGHGSIVMQAKAHIEDMSRSRSRIVVTELPYQVNKSNLLERIAELVRDGRLEGITDLRDESDRTGMRICIETTRTADVRQLLVDLYKLTPLQTTFGVSLLALVEGEPRLLSLKRMLLYYLEHRQAVIVLRSRFDLKRAKARAHILEGLLKALDILDEVIALIRGSRTADMARQGLMSQFGFSEAQAIAILDMQLRRLAALERKRLQDEYRDTVALIKELEALLASPKKQLALIRQDMQELKKRFGDARRTQIADRTKGALTTADVLPDDEAWYLMDADGTLQRQRGQPGEVEATLGSAGAGLLLATRARARDDLAVVSSRGVASRFPAHQIGEAPGAHYSDVSGLARREQPVALVTLARPGADDPAPPASYLAMATAQGKVKRIALADLASTNTASTPVIALDEGDELVWAGPSDGAGEILLLTLAGQAIRFLEEEVRPMGLPAMGIGGIKLLARDRVVAAVVLGKRADQDGAVTEVALLSATGYGKRVPQQDFPTQGRNGLGVLALRPSDKSGYLAGGALLGSGDCLIALTAGGTAKVIPSKQFPQAMRSAVAREVLPAPEGDPYQRAFGLPGVMVGPATEKVGVTGAGTGRGKRAVSGKAKPAARRKPAVSTAIAAGRPPTAASAPGKPPAAPKAAPAWSSAAATPPSAASPPWPLEASASGEQVPAGESRRPASPAKAEGQSKAQSGDAGKAEATGAGPKAPSVRRAPATHTAKAKPAQEEDASIPNATSAKATAKVLPAKPAATAKGAPAGQPAAQPKPAKGKGATARQPVDPAPAAKKAPQTEPPEQLVLIQVELRPVPKRTSRPKPPAEGSAQPGTAPKSSKSRQGEQ